MKKDKFSEWHTKEKQSQNILKEKEGSI